jgi:hypothetical protein
MTNSIKVSIQDVKQDYFGAKSYRAESSCGTIVEYIRAYNREEAKKEVLTIAKTRNINVSFYR